MFDALCLGKLALVQLLIKAALRQQFFVEFRAQ